MQFKRENRYKVLKVSDMKAALTQEEQNKLEKLFDKAAHHREEQNRKPLTCVVVESDWPEYEPVWEMIETRMNGKPKTTSAITIQSELELFQKTGNSSHARWIANELLKIQKESKLQNIDQLHDITVGHGSGGEIKSGLLWAVIEHKETTIEQLAKNLNETANKLALSKKSGDELARTVKNWLANFDKTARERS